MIANLFYVEELSPSQAETISGGYPAKWGNNDYEVQPTKPGDKSSGDWTVTWVRTQPKPGNTPDIYNFSATLKPTPTPPSP